MQVDGATPRATKIARIIQKRLPLAQKIETVESNLKALSAALRKLEKQRDQLLDRVGDSVTIGRLKEIDCSIIWYSTKSTEVLIIEEIVKV